MYIMVRDKGDKMNKIYKNLSNEKSRKSAFTLAEVLITLGIIGVVAALVMPGIVNYFKVKELETRFKKTDAMIQTALKKTANEYGFSDIKEFNIPPGVNNRTPENESALLAHAEKLNIIFLNQFRIIDKTDNMTRYAQRNKIPAASDLNGNGANYIFGAYNYPGYILVDGAMISHLMAFCTGGTAHPCRLSIAIDTNGPFKGPNRNGYDVFRYDSYFDTKPSQASCSFSSGGSGCYTYAHMNKNPTGKSNSYWDILYKPASYW